VDGAICALLSRSHILIIGPPGTAKSMLANMLCSCIEGANYFYWLLTKFTTPEELFGPISLKSLQQDSFKRVTSGKLPVAHIAFLDEVFKASSSILNCLLTLINERIFHDGEKAVDVPLITLFGASNEIPEEDELVALYDRFLLRYVVNYVKEDFRFIKMLKSSSSEIGTRLTLKDIDTLSSQAEKVSIPDAIISDITELRKELNRKGIVCSDRRYRQSLNVLKSYAFIQGRDKVTEEDLHVLSNVLWSEPSERQPVIETIHHMLMGYEDESQKLLFQARELFDYVKRPWEDDQLASRAAIEAHTKVSRILQTLSSTLEQALQKGRRVEKLKEIINEVQKIRNEIMTDYLKSPVKTVS
jgi:MoxR-like ATPase